MGTMKMRRFGCGTVLASLVALLGACGGVSFESIDGGAADSGGADGGADGGGSGGGSGGGGGGGGSGGGGGGGATDGGGGGGGGGGGAPWSPVCPTDIPSAGAPCSIEGLSCEYGQVDPDPACATLFQCTNGRFQPSQQTGFYGPCTKGQPNGPSCAPAFDQVQRGAACDPDGAVCRYEKGDCQCHPDFGGPIQLPDASQGATWHCDDPGPGCPTPRARIGSACVGNLSCMYRECEFAEQCQNGYWLSEQVACAQANGQ